MFLFAKYDNTIVGRHQPQNCLESAKTYTYDLISGLSWDPVGVLEVGELRSGMCRGNVHWASGHLYPSPSSTLPGQAPTSSGLLGYVIPSGLPTVSGSNISFVTGLWSRRH